MASRRPLESLNNNKHSSLVNTVSPFMPSSIEPNETNAINPTSENVSIASNSDHNTIIANNIFMNDVGVIDFDTSWECFK